MPAVIMNKLCTCNFSLTVQTYTNTFFSDKFLLPTSFETVSKTSMVQQLHTIEVSCEITQSRKLLFSYCFISVCLCYYMVLKFVP